MESTYGRDATAAHRLPFHRSSVRPASQTSEALEPQKTSAPEPEGNPMDVQDEPSQ